MEEPGRIIEPQVVVMVEVAVAVAVDVVVPVALLLIEMSNKRGNRKSTGSRYLALI